MNQITEELQFERKSYLLIQLQKLCKQNFRTLKMMIKPQEKIINSVIALISLISSEQISTWNQAQQFLNNEPNIIESLQNIVYHPERIGNKESFLIFLKKASVDSTYQQAIDFTQFLQTLYEILRLFQEFIGEEQSSQYAQVETFISSKKASKSSHTKSPLKVHVKALTPKMFKEKGISFAKQQMEDSTQITEDCESHLNDKMSQFLQFQSIQQPSPGGRSQMSSKSACLIKAYHIPKSNVSPEAQQLKLQIKRNIKEILNIKQQQERLKWDVEREAKEIKKKQENQQIDDDLIRSKLFVRLQILYFLLA